MISDKTTLVLALSIWYFDSILSDVISGIKVNNPYGGLSFCDIWKSVLMVDIKKMTGIPKITDVSKNLCSCQNHLSSKK